MNAHETMLKTVEDYTAALWEKGTDINVIRTELDKFMEHEVINDYRTKD